VKAITLIPAAQALAEIESALDRIDPARAGLDAPSRLALVRSSRRIRARVEALTATLIGEADQANASLIAAGTPLKSWLGMGETLSRREASAAVGRARVLAEHPLIGEAATAGRIGIGQAQAIGRVLQGLAPQLSAQQQAAAEQVMVGLASHLDSEQLAKAAPLVLAEVAPSDAETLLETKLQREAEQAHRQRSLRWFTDAGSIRFEGSLPRAEGERLITLVNLHAESLRRTAIEARDPLATPVTQEQRRADAFLAMLLSVEKSKPIPGVGGARVIVKLDYQHLLGAAAAAGILSEDQPISAAELRQLCCDAELIPAVLGEAGEVLDVGRSSRLVTAPIRTALILRDGGCVFPGCRLRPELCEAHHIIPWWDGGNTALSNLVLLCHTHHALVEPAKYGLRDQWQVQLDATGKPEFIAPRRCRSQLATTESSSAVDPAPSLRGRAQPNPEQPGAPPRQVA